MDQACLYDYEIKEQYCKANNTLHEVISQSCANGIISQPLKEAIEKFQVKMNGKEQYLAYWVRKSITTSYDAMTTSSVESMNNHIKHKSKVGSNCMLHFTVIQICIILLIVMFLQCILFFGDRQTL